MSLGHGGSVDRATSFLRAIYREFTEKEIPFMAGSVAYSAFLSLFPLLLLALILASMIGGDQLVQYVTAFTSDYLTPTTQGIVLDAVQQASGRVGFSIFGVATLVWGVLRVFRGLDTAFSELYEVPGRAGFLEKMRDGIVVLAGITVAVLAMLAAAAVYAVAPQIPFVNVANFLFLIVGLSVAFFPIYYVFPDVEVTAREVAPGTVAAAVGWAVLQALFQVYVSVSSANELYGAIGGVILVITWLYFGAVVLLLGAAVNVVLSGRNRSGPPGNEPDARESGRNRPPDSPGGTRSDGSTGSH